jgi:ferredoxin
LTIGLAGGSGTYYVSYNSNNAVVQTVLSGSNLTLTGLTNGTASLTVCSSIGGCNVLYITVNYLSSGGTLSLSQSNVAILVGQTLTVIVSGGTSPYSLTANSGTVFTSAIAGNTMTLYGVRAGNSYVNVCSAEAACIPLNVTVTGSGTTSLVASPTSVSLNIGKSTTVYLSGSGGYYLSGNTNQGVSTATISGSYISITGVAVGSNVISACQSGGQCTSISVSVTNTTTTSSTSPTSFLVINKNIAIISAGQSSTSTITGGLGSNYSVAYNSSPSTV